jgi:hypothetical protein
MMPALTARLERYFEFQPLRTNWRTEILAGAAAHRRNRGICRSLRIVRRAA